MVYYSRGHVNPITQSRGNYPLCLTENYGNIHLYLKNSNNAIIERTHDSIQGQGPKT